MNYIIPEKIKSKIKGELKQYEAESPNIFSDNVLDIFFKVLLFDLNDSSLKLDGLQTRVLMAMSKIFLEDLPKQETVSFFPDFAKVEPLLKKILYIVNPTLFLTLSSQNKGLGAYIDALNLNPNNIRFDQATYNSISSLSNFSSELLRVYNLRNIESHSCELWTQKELYLNIESVLVVYVFATYKHIAALRAKVNQKPDLTGYLEKVVIDFELWQQRFVHISGREKFEEVDMFAIESDDWSDRQKDSLREGKIDDLRKNNEEKTMVVLGEPGMGKSTTLQYMSYKDAKELLSQPNKNGVKIPIYLELKLLSTTDSVIGYATKKIGISEDKFVEYLVKGDVTLFLDGLNEVLTELRKPVRMEIQNLISEYPKLPIIITSRPLAYSNEFKKSPVFVLQRMENYQVQEFLEKNCSHKQTRSIIVKELDVNPKLGRLIRIPLLLKMLINVVWVNRGMIPPNKVQIIKQFIQNLYEREKRKQTMEIDLRIIHRLLCYLAFKTREKNGSNVGCLLEEYEAIMEDRIEKSKFKITVFEFFDTAMDLNILVMDGNKFSFIHEIYQEYFASEEIFKQQAKVK